MSKNSQNDEKIHNNYRIISDSSASSSNIHHNHHLPSSSLLSYYSLNQKPNHYHKSFELIITKIVNKPSFVLLLVVYNISMSTLNAWIAFELLYCGIRKRYNFLCQLVDVVSIHRDHNIRNDLNEDDQYENRVSNNNSNGHHHDTVQK